MAPIKKNTSPKSRLQEKDKLFFQHLPAFARFILEKHLDDFTREQLKNSFEEEVPLMKLLSGYSPEQLQELAKTSGAEFLTSLAENKGTEYITKSAMDFIKNQIPFFESDAVVAEDITSISFVRRKTFSSYLILYTRDLDLFINVMEEVDRFISENETASFNAYLQIQQEKINSINKQLAQREQELLEAQELADMGSFSWNLEGGKSSFTPGLMKIFEMKETSNLESFLEDVHEEDREKLQAALDRALTGDGIYECEYRFVKNKKQKHIWSKGKVTFNKAGKPACMQGTVMDVTNKYNLLIKLQQSEELHNQAQALTHIGNWTWDPSSNAMQCSDEMYRILGLEPEEGEMELERFLSFVHPDERQNRKDDILASLKTLQAENYQLRMVTPAGKVKMVQGKGEVLTDKYQKVVRLAGTCQDVSREYQLNGELQEKEEYLNQIITNAPDAVIVIDETSTISLWNPKTEQIFGWKASEVIGRALYDTIIPLQYRQAHKEGMKRLIETGEQKILNKTLEITALNKAGDEFYISLTISQALQDGRKLFIAFIRDISEEMQNKVELQAKTDELEALNMSLESKNMELERLNKELESFNYIASHDLQEPLRKIQIFTNRIIEKSGRNMPDSALEYVEKIRSSSARMKMLIEDLLIFSQSITSEKNFELVNLNGILEEVKNTLSAAIEEKKVVIRSANLPVVQVVPFQFQQVLLNLIVNAVKYSKAGVPPNIMISCQVVGADKLKFAGMAVSGNYFEIKIEDNGIGFDQNQAESIFRLFHRLHRRDEYSGTGIGLAICKKIIQNHNGFIKATSTPGTGSTFYIYLPFEKNQDKNIMQN